MLPSDELEAAKTLSALAGFCQELAEQGILRDPHGNVDLADQGGPAKRHKRAASVVDKDAAVPGPSAGMPAAASSCAGVKMQDVFHLLHLAHLHTSVPAAAVSKS